MNRRIANSAEVLIADGLDECDPDRADVAAGLIQWGISHPGTHICVLTRAVGHSPALLPNFFHAELQPLQHIEIRKIARELISAVEKNESVRGALIGQFIETVKTRESRTAAAIAARNPLLLSFLVRLFLDHEPLTGNRSALFSRIIELILRPVNPILSTAGVQPSSTVDACELTARITFSSTTCPRRSG